MGQTVCMLFVLALVVAQSSALSPVAAAIDQSSSSATGTASPVIAADLDTLPASQLLARRDAAAAQVRELPEEIRNAQYQIERLERVDTDLAMARTSLEEAKRSRNEDIIARETAMVVRFEQDLATKPTRLPELKSSLDRLFQEQTSAEATLNILEREVFRRTDLNAPQQQFRLTMSIAFGALVAIVIIGFFLTAGRDESIRRNVFSGQAGLQFITLFSLVIAIILFGIIGVLESKELSALLGGLSGYILGRTTGQREEVAMPK